jgi:hypothetical protein
LRRTVIGTGAIAITTIGEHRRVAPWNELGVTQLMGSECSVKRRTME